MSGTLVADDAVVTGDGAAALAARAAPPRKARTRFGQSQAVAQREPCDERPGRPHLDLRKEYPMGDRSCTRSPASR